MSEQERLSRPQLVVDAVLGGACLALAVLVHLGGSEAVAANRPPNTFSVLLTVLAVGPIVVRRLLPLPVLVATLLGVVLLVATRNTVGVATVGCTFAFATAMAAGGRRQMWQTLAVMVTGVAVGLGLRPVDLSASGAVITVAVFTGAGLLGLGMRQRRERYEADVTAARERAARSAAEERVRITRELHDILGHAMSVMVVQAGVAERLLDSDPASARSAVALIGSTGRASLAEMRQVLTALRAGNPAAEQPPPREPAPGLADLPALLSRVQDAGLRVELNVEGEERSLPPGLELAAYRVVQEALTNCIKHAGAGHADVHVLHGVAALEVRVLDDGQGSSGPAGVGGQGLVGMRERVAVYGGELGAGPGAGGGFEVRARFPVTNSAAAMSTLPVTGPRAAASGGAPR